MTLGDQIVDRARAYVGAPFRHCGTQPATGLDCVGLVLAVAHSLGLTDYIPAPYSREVEPNHLQAELERFMVEVIPPALEPGDILLLKVQNRPTHVGIYTGITLIHAFEPVGRVVEVTWSPYWAERVEAVYRWRQ